MISRKRLYDILGLLAPVGKLFFHQKLRVLAYHDVTDREKFENQIYYLKDNYNIISTKDLENIIYNKKVLKKNSVLITFDDGDISNYTNAFPILKKHNIPATLFVITKLVNSQFPFWWKEMEYYLGKKEGRKTVWESKEWKNEKRLAYLRELKDDYIGTPLESQQLKINELNEMKKFGFCIANHSNTHPMFNRCDFNEINDELNTSINFLKQNNFSANYFAYPNGNWDANSEIALKKFKFKLAFIFDHNLSKLTNPLRISRLRVDADSDLSEFKFKVSGLHSIIYHKSFQ